MRRILERHELPDSQPARCLQLVRLTSQAMTRGTYQKFLQI
jgi:hypothetical protein